MLIYFDVRINILAANECVPKEVGERDERHNVAVHVTDLVSETILDERQKTATDDHGHEETRSFCGILAETLSSEVEYAGPHDRSAETAEDEE